MEESRQIVIEDLHLEPDKPRADYFCQNFKIFPEKREISGGYLFGLIEIKATPVIEAERIAITIINTLKDNYYQQIMSSPIPQKLNLETIFEFALNRTNQRLTELIQIGQLSLIKENLNYFIGLAKPDGSKIDIYFTNHGQLQAFLLHHSKKNTCHLISVIEPETTAPDNNNRTKIFSDIAAGQINQADMFIVATEQFCTFISPNKIKHVLLNNPLNEALTYFRSLVKNFSGRQAFTHSLMVIKPQAKSPYEVGTASQKSIDEFINTTDNTERLLTPGLASSFTDRLKKIFHVSKNKSTSSKNIFYYLWWLVKAIPVFVFSIFKVIYLLISGRKKISWMQIKDALKTKTAASSTLAATPKLTRFKLTTILVVIALLIGGLTYGLIWTKNQSLKKAEQEQYSKQLQSIKGYLNEAEASLIYRNQEQSLAKLELALKEVQYLPQATPDQQTNYNELQNQIQEMKDKIFNLEKVVPQTMVELVIDGQALTVTKIIHEGDFLYAFGGGTNLAKINLAEKKLGQLIPCQSQIYDATNYNNKLYFISENKQFLSLTDNQLMKLNGSFAETPQDSAIYNNHFYFLNKNTQQIDKYPGTLDGFGAPQTWIKDRQDADLSAATAMTIDGGIYVLNRDGVINKFYAGKKEPFVSPNIQPAITNAAKIITRDDWTNLYILDADSNRLIIIKKTGELVKQLAFESLPSVSDLTLSADAKKGYILSENKIYQFDL